MNFRTALLAICDFEGLALRPLHLFGFWHVMILKRRRWSFWFHRWTPVWHKGRGSYVSIGVGLFGLYRGY